MIKKILILLFLFTTLTTNLHADVFNFDGEKLFRIIEKQMDIISDSGDKTIQENYCSTKSMFLATTLSILVLLLPFLKLLAVFFILLSFYLIFISSDKSDENKKLLKGLLYLVFSFLFLVNSTSFIEWVEKMSVRVNNACVGGGSISMYEMLIPDVSSGFFLITTVVGVMIVIASIVRFTFYKKNSDRDVITNFYLLIFGVILIMLSDFISWAIGG